MLMSKMSFGHREFARIQLDKASLLEAVQANLELRGSNEELFKEQMVYHLSIF